MLQSSGNERCGTVYRMGRGGCEGEKVYRPGVVSAQRFGLEEQTQPRFYLDKLLDRPNLTIVPHTPQKKERESSNPRRR